MPSDAVLEQIAKVASESEAAITANQAASVLAAYRLILGGDPIGMIRRDPDTGSLAHRVTVDGLHMWRVSTPEGEQYNDLQPTLPWPEL
jgi:hypothetical protein